MFFTNFVSLSFEAPTVGPARNPLHAPPSVFALARHKQRRPKAEPCGARLQKRAHVVRRNAADWDQWNFTRDHGALGFYDITAELFSGEHL